MDKAYWFFWIGMVCVVIAIVFEAYILFYTRDVLERCEMYRVEPYSKLKGFYNSTGDYFCVWVKDESLSDIENTWNHEVCHAMIHEDNKHFCPIA